MKKNKQKRSYGSLIQMLKYLLRYKWRLAAVLFFAVSCNVLALLVPEITGLMVDSLNLGERMVDFESLFRNALNILIIALAAWALAVAQNRLMIVTAQRMVVDLRHDVFDKLMKLPISYFDGNTKGNIISIVSTDVENISDTVSNDLIMLITGLVTLAVSLTKMLNISPALSCIFLVTIPMMLVASRIISQNARRLFREKKANYGKLCGYAEEMITAQKTVKVYGIEEYNKEGFNETSKKLREAGTKAEFVSSTMMPTMNMINNLNFIGICAFGAILALQGKITIGNISTFVLYSKRFAGPIIDTANIVNMLQTTLAACDRVFSILNAEPEADDENAQAAPKSIKGEIAFEDVSFSYNTDTQVLKDVDFTIKPGEKIAVVGATGAGKTTIISLLLRFYEATSGKITIDGVDISKIKLNELRRYYALVLQDSWLFEGTVMENLIYAIDKGAKTEEQVKEICRQIDVDDFIMSLEDGYNTLLKSDSGGLSQGQKQMINIARAFLCNPPIFVLDEATSSVDTVAEQKIKIVTDKVTKNKTSIIIAHRLSTILNADRIIYIKDGEIAEIGSHNELMEKGGLYKELYESQYAMLNN